MIKIENDIENCLTCLRNGDLILYPTDTIWGIGCDATNADAVRKVYQLKERPDNKAMIVLVADEREILQYVAAPDLGLFDYLAEATRPTTVIYDNAIGLAENLIAEDGSIAIRICHDEFCRHLLKRFKKPIVSTSANISGENSPATFNDISEKIRMGVNYVVHHRQDDQTPAISSSIIKWENGKVLQIR